MSSWECLGEEGHPHAPHRDFLPGLLWLAAAAVDSGGTVVLVSQDGIQRPPSASPREGTSCSSSHAWRTGCSPTGSWTFTALVSAGGSVSDHGAQEAGLGVSRGEGSSGLRAPCVAAWAQARPQGPLGLCGLGGRVCPRPDVGVCSFRAKYSQTASEAPRVHPSPRLQTRKMTRPRITCSGSSIPACSLNW